MAFDKNNHFYEEKRIFRKNTSHLQPSLFGIVPLEQTPFCPATFFNFQNRLLSQEALKESYRDFEVFSVFERVYTGHFTIIDDKRTYYFDRYD